MAKAFKKLLSVISVILIVAMAVVPSALAAPSYPENITKQQVSEAITKTDTALMNLISTTQEKSLKQLVGRELYCDETLSAVIVGLYSALEENGETLSSIGLDLSPKAVASGLKAYPKAQKALSQAESWKELEGKGLSFGVKKQQGFIKAMSHSLAPFNDILYMLLCGGSFSLNSVIGIEGDMGYEKAIIPTLKALGCEKITDSAVFYSQAKQDKSTMLSNILGDIFYFLDGILEAPCDRLTDILPGVAHYLSGGGFDKAVSALIEPLRLQIFNISTFIKVETILSFIQDSESFTQSFTLNLDDILAGTGLKMADIDLQTIAACGTVSGDTVIADKADTFMVLLQWLFDTLRLNKDNLSGLMGEASPEMTEILDTLFAKTTPELTELFLSFFCGGEAKVNNYSWSFGEYTPVTVTYTPNLGRDNFQKVADGIDELINEFIAEGKKHETVREALAPKIYSNALVTEIIKGIYGLLTSEELKPLTQMAGLYILPQDLAYFIENPDIGYVFSHTPSWEYINDISWDFISGDRDGFTDTLTQVLSPFEEILNMLLAEGKITLLGSVEIYGSDGYNTAIIPLLEALGCSKDAIADYDTFKQAASEGKAVETILKAVTSLIDRILDRPVYTVTEILPNLLWFIENKGIETALENLMFPFMELLDKLGMKQALDVSALTQDMDIEKLLGEMTEGSDMPFDLGTLNIKELMSMGEMVTVESKRTSGGAPVTISYIKADQPAIMVTLVRMIAEMMKTPGNEDMMMGFMGSGSNDMFSSFSGGIGDEMAAMSVDETVEWLYKIFFRERAVRDIPQTSEYLPTIIYAPESKDTGSAVIMLLMLFIAGCEVIAIKKREKIATYLEYRRIDKENKKERKLQEV